MILRPCPRFGARAGVCGGAVYALNERRVWSSDLDASAVCAAVCQAVPQEVKDVNAQVSGTPEVGSPGFVMGLEAVIPR